MFGLLLLACSVKKRSFCLSRRADISSVHWISKSPHPMLVRDWSAHLPVRFVMGASAGILAANSGDRGSLGRNST